MLQADWFQVSRSFGYFPTPVISGDFLELGCMNPTLSHWEERKHPIGYLAIQRSRLNLSHGKVWRVCCHGCPERINYWHIHKFYLDFFKIWSCHTLGPGDIWLMFYLTACSLPKLRDGKIRLSGGKIPSEFLDHSSWPGSSGDPFLGLVAIESPGCWRFGIWIFVRFRKRWWWNFSPKNSE